MDKSCTRQPCEGCECSFFGGRYRMFGIMPQSSPEPPLELTLPGIFNRMAFNICAESEQESEG